MKWALCAVAAAGLLVLGWRAGAVGLAGDYLDPVSRIGAQDEALYAHSAIAMANGGGWLTPMFMGRFGLYKPPLLMWASGFSARVFGISAWSLRLPVVAAMSAAVCFVFLWVLDLRGWAAAAGAGALVLSNHLWVVMGAMCLTDGLLAVSIAVGCYVLHRDPQLDSRRGFAAFALAIAAGILAKSVAGLLPVAILGLYWILAPVKSRPCARRAAAAVGCGCVAAAPWFLYQLAVHPRWFLAEHIGLELVAFGTRTPPQTSREGQVSFYLLRQWLLDPPLVLLALAAVPAWVAALRRRSPAALLLFSWSAVVAGSALAWRYRNLSYLLPMVPALAILAAGYGPLFKGRRAAWALSLAVVVFAIKAANPSQPWGLSFAPGTKLELAPVLSGYCEMGRGNELIQVGMDDALYASVLPLERVRYLFVGADAPPSGYSLDFPGMGIVLKATEFADLAAAKAKALPSLREWGLDSTAPVGTVILARSKDELSLVMRAHPGADFLVPKELREWVERDAAETHEVRAVSPGRVLLLSRQGKRRSGDSRACRL